jgi:hypothetical protein
MLISHANGKVKNEKCSLNQNLQLKYNKSSICMIQCAKIGHSGEPLFIILHWCHLHGQQSQYLPCY